MQRNKASEGVFTFNTNLNNTNNPFRIGSEIAKLAFAISQPKPNLQNLYLAFLNRLLQEKYIYDKLVSNQKLNFEKYQSSDSPFLFSLVNNILHYLTIPGGVLKKSRLDKVILDTIKYDESLSKKREGIASLSLQI